MCPATPVEAPAAALVDADTRIPAILGIDPGVHGALTLLDLETGKKLEVFDVPIMKVNGKNCIIPMMALQLLRDINARYDVRHTYLELVGPRQNDGKGQCFIFGFGAATLETAILAAGMPLTKVTPGQWKPAMKAPALKNEARRRAMELFPNDPDLWSRNKDDGRAESAMIALYGWTQFTQNMNAGRRRAAAAQPIQQHVDAELAATEAHQAEKASRKRPASTRATAKPAATTAA